MDGARVPAVTGASGRVGSALISVLGGRNGGVLAWRRPEYDLDDPEAGRRLVARDKPAVVFHAAAWTDVDGCAREPALAMRRNGAATADLARACAATGVDMVYVSTNEVFDGERADGRGYAEDDPTAPLNPYGRSKLAGEEAVREAFAGSGAKAWIVRTSWVFGPPGNDFPVRITAAYDSMTGGQALRVVADEHGRPTYAPELAAALVRLVDRAPPGTYHLAGAGAATRHDWALAVLDVCRPDARIEPIGLADYRRASVPPRWGVLDTTRAAAYGVALRPWDEALADYLAEICPRP